jgi:hypothetical protein
MSMLRTVGSLKDFSGIVEVIKLLIHSGFDKSPPMLHLLISQFFIPRLNYQEESSFIA